MPWETLFTVVVNSGNVRAARARGGRSRAVRGGHKSRRTTDTQHRRRLRIRERVRMNHFEPTDALSKISDRPKSPGTGQHLSARTARPHGVGRPPSYAA